MYIIINRLHVCAWSWNSTYSLLDALLDISRSQMCKSLDIQETIKHILMLKSHYNFLHLWTEICLGAHDESLRITNICLFGG